MNCREAQKWLLQAERPDSPDVGPPEVIDHLRGCARCRKVVGRANRLEQIHREAPVPASARRARIAFLRRLADPPVYRPWRRLVRLAVAALVLLALGLGTWALLMPNRASAADLIERLVEWELEMTEAASPAERQRIFAERAGTFQADLRRARLPEEDRALVQYLYDTSAALAQQQGALEDAERFDEVAQRLLERLQSPAGDKPQEEKARVAFARCYHRVLERGVDANLERAQFNKRLGPRHKRRLERLHKRDHDRGERLERMFEEGPHGAEREVRQELDRPRWRHKHKHKGRPRGRR
jgi:hypothetical protein